MWIVNLALRRPLTFLVLAIFILIAGVLSILSTPKDIFPSINIPVISVIWNYTGMSPRDVADHLTTPYERVLTTTVDNIEHIESESLYGIAVVKIFLQPNASDPRGKFGRVLFGAPTIYLALPLSCAHWALVRRWAEPHFSSSFGLMPPGVMVIYTPRDESEQAVCRLLFQHAYAYFVGWLPTRFSRARAGRLGPFPGAEARTEHATKAGA
jgi:hypothetical protein